MEERNIIEITTTFKSVGLGFVFRGEWEEISIFLLFMSVSIVFTPKTKYNKWIDYQHNK